MQSRKAIWSASAVGIILIVIFVYAVYRGQGKTEQDTIDPTRNDGVEYVPAENRRSLGRNEV